MNDLAKFAAAVDTLSDVNPDLEREWARTLRSLDCQAGEARERRPDLVAEFEASWNRHPVPMIAVPADLLADAAETDRLLGEAYTRFCKHRSRTMYRAECRAVTERPGLEFAQAIDHARAKREVSK